jgi:hypothetical protein
MRADYDTQPSGLKVTTRSVSSEYGYDLVNRPNIVGSSQEVGVERTTALIANYKNNTRATRLALHRQPWLQLTSQVYCCL